MPDQTAQQPTEEESQYATEAGQVGKPIGPEHDGSFHAPDFYDPKTGKRIETPWDTEAQKNDPGFDPEVMAGTVEKPPAKADQPSQPQPQPQPGETPSGQTAPEGEGEGGASGGEAGETYPQSAPEEPPQ